MRVAKLPYHPQTLEIPPAPPPLRNKRSMASESGGEEILYPRQPKPMDVPMPDLPLPSTPEKKPIKLAESASITGEAFATPPTSFVSPMRGARKRTSEEFELDLNGVLTSKYSSAV